MLVIVIIIRHLTKSYNDIIPVYMYMVYKKYKMMDRTSADCISVPATTVFWSVAHRHEVKREHNRARQKKSRAKLITPEQKVIIREQNTAGQIKRRAKLTQDQSNIIRKKNTLHRSQQRKCAQKTTTSAIQTTFRNTIRNQDLDSSSSVTNCDYITGILGQGGALRELSGEDAFKADMFWLKDYNPPNNMAMSQSPTELTINSGLKLNFVEIHLTFDQPFKPIPAEDCDFVAILCNEMRGKPPNASTPGLVYGAFNTFFEQDRKLIKPQLFVDRMKSLFPVELLHYRVMVLKTTDNFITHIDTIQGYVGVAGDSNIQAEMTIQLNMDSNRVTLLVDGSNHWSHAHIYDSCVDLTRNVFDVQHPFWELHALNNVFLASPLVRFQDSDGSHTVIRNKTT
jgi:hypothetical protein